MNEKCIIQELQELQFTENPGEMTKEFDCTKEINNNNYFDIFFNDVKLLIED